jgi:hypothetical protein
VALTAEQKKDILGQYGLHDSDTGSPEAQVALLTKRIADLTEHLKVHKQSTTRGADSAAGGSAPPPARARRPWSTWSATAPLIDRSWPASLTQTPTLPCRPQGCCGVTWLRSSAVRRERLGAVLADP